MLSSPSCHRACQCCCTRRLIEQELRINEKKVAMPDLRHVVALHGAYVVTLACCSKMVFTILRGCRESHKGPGTKCGSLYQAGTQDLS